MNFMTLAELHLWIDHSERSAAGQMAVDEAAFEVSLKTGAALMRFYRWSAPAVTIGYFDQYPESESRPVIRRMTGGGLVEHGNDLTFCLTLPPGCEAANQTTSERYRWVHEAIFRALKASGMSVAFVDDDFKSLGPCFSNPVKWDLLNDQGEKIVGGAQRKSRGGVIHQGSLQFASGELFPKWLEYACNGLSSNVLPISGEPSISVEKLANSLITNKYEQLEWNKTRKFSSR